MRCARPPTPRPQLYDLGLRVFGKRVMGAALRGTLAAHFTGGESLSDLSKKVGRTCGRISAGPLPADAGAAQIQQLNDAGIGGILDYAAEADLGGPSADEGDGKRVPEAPPGPGE